METEVKETSAAKVFSVLTVPMRNGNLRNFITEPNAQIVLTVPMRNGNGVHLYSQYIFAWFLPYL